MTNSFSHTLITTFCDQCVPSIHVAFDEVYYLERACMTQLMAMGAAGREAIKAGKKRMLIFFAYLFTSLFQEMPLEVQAATSKSIMGEERELLDKYAAKHFYARWNKYKAEASDVFI